MDAPFFKYSIIWFLFLDALERNWFPFFEFVDTSFVVLQTILFGSTYILLMELIDPFSVSFRFLGFSGSSWELVDLWNVCSFCKILYIASCKKTVRKNSFPAFRTWTSWKRLNITTQSKACLCNKEVKLNVSPDRQYTQTFKSMLSQTQIFGTNVLCTLCVHFNFAPFQRSAEWRYIYS